MAKKRRKQTQTKRVEAKPPAAETRRSSQLLPLVLLLLVGGVAIAVYVLDPVGEFTPQDEQTAAQPPPSSDIPASDTAARKFSLGESDEVTLWWGPVDSKIQDASFRDTDHSNIRARDYIGHQSCQKCHKENHASWSKHSHRWMNALANPGTVKGDFSGRVTLSYLGGKADFYREAGEYRMRLERDNVKRVYRITQTLGSRFFQYYIGTLVSGPEPRAHPFYHEEHVMGFGYWIGNNEWVPTVHVGPELADGQRQDPFTPTTDPPYYHIYAKDCSQCHSTYPMGDWLVRQPDLACLHTPYPLHLTMDGFLGEAHPEFLADRNPSSMATSEVMTKLAQFEEIKDVRAHSVDFGITCEACHYGAREHAEGKLKTPSFFPTSRHLSAQTGGELNLGRTAKNLNWTCGRCHIGARPSYENGISTWNSTEFSDAKRGACYSQLTCVQCHNPHQSIGEKWKRTREQDNASCLSCHEEFSEPAKLEGHTHHGATSVGSDCMNCHMPRINEGLQDMVRTHTIFSPTEREMIESNQPNACNMCHTDWPIDRTVEALTKWYGASYSEAKIASSHPHRKEPAAIGWLKSEDEAVRLVGADSLIRSGANWALPDLLELLNDPYLINRQFTSKRLEEMLGVRLSDFGYRFYQMPQERKAPLRQVRKALLKNEGDVSRVGDVSARRP